MVSAQDGVTRSHL